jgi:hypothetical protein
VVAVLLKVEAALLPKGCGGTAGVEPNGTGAWAGVDEPNAIGAGAPNPGAAADVEPNVVDDCAGVAEPKCIAFEGAGVDPNPELGPAARVEPKLIGAAGAGTVEPNAGATGAGAIVDPNEKGAAGVSAGAGVDPKERGAAGAGVEPKVRAGVGAGVPDAARELLEVLPNDRGTIEDTKPEAGIDELSFVGFVDGFPNKKGAGAPACVDAGSSAGTSLDVLDPNDMLGWLEDTVFETNPPRRFFLELRSSMPSVATLPSEGITALLDPVDDPAFAPKENVAFAAESVGAADVLAELLPKENPGVVVWAVVEAVAELLPKEKAGAPGLLSFVVEAGSVVETFTVSWLEVELVSLFVPKLNFGACAELDPGVDEVAKLPNNCAPLLVPVNGVGTAVTPTLGDGEGAGATLEDPKVKGFGAASEDVGGGGELWAAVDVADGDISLTGAPNWKPPIVAEVLVVALGADDDPNWNPPDAVVLLAVLLDADGAGAPNVKPPVVILLLDIDDDGAAAVPAAAEFPKENPVDDI